MVMLKPWDLWELRHWAAPDRLANSKVISVDIQEKPLLDKVFYYFQTLRQKEVTCAGSVDFEEFEANSREDVKN